MAELGRLLMYEASRDWLVSRVDALCMKIVNFDNPIVSSLSFSFLYVCVSNLLLKCMHFICGFCL